MSLSQRAKHFLDKLPRDNNWIVDEEIAKNILKKENIEPFDEVLRFNRDYAGYDFHSKYKYDEGFTAYIFTKNEGDFYYEKLEERYIFRCLDPISNIGVTFFLTEKGEFCTQLRDDSINILNASFDNFVECIALRDKIYNWIFYGFNKLFNDSKFIELMNSEFNLIVECSDEYHKFWQNRNLVIEMGNCWDRRESYINIYGKSEEICQKWIELMTIEGIFERNNG